MSNPTGTTPPAPVPNTPQVTSGAITQAPLRDQDDFFDRVSKFTEYFSRPSISAALLQAGARLLQPIPVGGNIGSQIGLAVAEGGEAAGRVQQFAAERVDAEAEQSVARRTAAVREAAQTTNEGRLTTEQATQRTREAAQRTNEGRLGVETAAEKRLREAAEAQASRGERGLDIESRKLDIVEQQNAILNTIRQQQADSDTLRALASQETNTIRRKEIESQISIARERIDAEAKRLSAQIISREKIAADSLELNVLAKMFQNAILGTPVETTTSQFKAALATVKQAKASGTLPQGTPNSPEELSDEAYRQIFADPRMEFNLRVLFPTAEHQAFIDAKRAEIRGAPSSVAPSAAPAGEAPPERAPVPEAPPPAPVAPTPPRSGAAGRRDSRNRRRREQ